MTDDKKPTTVAELEAELGGFIGTTTYYQSFPPTVYLTDGIKYVADRVGAHWLFSDVSVLIKVKFRDVLFQAWYLDVKADTTAILCMQEDSGKPFIYHQKIPYTDFPVGRFEFWAVQGYIKQPGDVVIMLKSEY
jgi:hypothetical protein